MGESPFRNGRSLGRVAALGLACAAGVLLPQAAMAQSRSPAGDKGGAKGLGGTIVQFEEKPSRAVIYLEEKGGLVTPVATPTAPANGEIATPRAAPQAAAKAAGKAAEKSTEAVANNGASPLRASQAKPAPAPGAARP